MNAHLSIELEILEPALVDSAERLLDLHPTQIRWISIRLTSDDESAAEPVAFSCQANDARVDVHSLVSFARRAQPSGTNVLVWYQGRTESFTL